MLNYRGGHEWATLLKIARELRREETEAEILFWELVRDRRFLGLKWRRQHQILHYVVDFYSHKTHVAVELDGGIHKSSENIKNDRERDEFLQEQGVRVYRITNDELFQDPEMTLCRLAEYMTHLPSPSGRGVGGEGSERARGERKKEGTKREIDVHN